MAGAVIRFLAGVMWSISGVMMTFNPQPAGSTILGLAIGCLGPTVLALIAVARYPGLR